MKKDAIKLLQEGDDLWRWAERHDPAEQPTEETHWLVRLFRKLFPKARE